MKHLYILAILFVSAQTWGQNNTSQNTLAKLKHKEQLSLDYKTSGCFYRADFKIVVTRVSKNWEATIYEAQEDLLGHEGRFYYLFDDGYFPLKRKTLTPADIQAFIRFENTLRKIDSRIAFCTTQDHYLVKSNYYNASVRDGNCQWNGFSNLVQVWFDELPRPNFAECLF